MSKNKPKLGNWAADAEYYSKLSADPTSVGVTPRTGFTGDQAQAAIGIGATALSGIFQARAALRQQQREEELNRKRNAVTIEGNRAQMANNIMQGIAARIAKSIAGA